MDLAETKDLPIHHILEKMREEKFMDFTRLLTVIVSGFSDESKLSVWKM